MFAPVLLHVHGDYYHFKANTVDIPNIMRVDVYMSIIKHCLLPMMNLFQVEKVYESRIENAAGIKNRRRCFIYLFCLQFYLFSMNRKVMKFESQQLVSRTGEDAGRTFLSFDFHCRRQSLREGKIKE